MKHLVLTLIIAISCSNIFAQTRIDGTFPFQTDPNKKYSIYIPSQYDPATSNKFMLGLHPLNTNRWDAEAWCDTLIVFAEMNNLVLACPDGGVDGAIDDPIDLAFTDALLDSMTLWYNIDETKTYVMGFSWGGKTTYTYGLDHPEIFRGYLPIGSAMSGTGEVNSVVGNAATKPVYIVHGGNDSPSQRYTPIKNALETNGALVNSILMSGVGHTIDFPNRNQILTTAFEWIDSVNCASIGTAVLETELNEVSLFSLQTNPVQNNHLIVEYDLTELEKVAFSIWDVSGKLVQEFATQNLSGNGKIELNLETNNGVHFLEIKTGIKKETIQFVKL